MSRFTKPLLIATTLLAATLGPVVSAADLAGIGRPATPKEVAAWDIDVRPDFKGLPKGSGTVQRGQDVWEGKCASCHGVFGESNNVFTPIIGGTTKEDMASGHVAALANGKQPQRTTMMKVPTVSTLWDYIHRAMPWNAPKSLSTEEVYAVTAYILNMAEVVPADFTLSDQNIAEVQKKMPNRNGMTLKHGMWDVKGTPDVHNVACMKDCPVQTTVSSFLPDAARGASGNLADQNRQFGPVRGVPSPASGTAVNAGATAKSALAAGPANQTVAAPVIAAPTAGQGVALLNQSSCVACHGMTNKIVGPGFNEIMAKYKGDAGAQARLEAKVKSGGSGVWGPIPMPPQATIKDDDIKTMVRWILTGS
ncbi:MAG: c-type cytochrome [Herminiimonas sp.]|nr:c-type cytochrome [Herminiimonas sp.]